MLMKLEICTFQFITVYDAMKSHSQNNLRKFSSRLIKRFSFPDSEWDFEEFLKISPLCFGAGEWLCLGTWTSTSRNPHEKWESFDAIWRFRLRSAHTHHVSKFENFFVTTFPRSMPSRSTIRWARSRCDDPENTLMFGMLHSLSVES